jgi:predicted DNA binding protein
VTGPTVGERVAEAHGWDVAVAEGTDGGARVEVTGVGGAGRDGVVVVPPIVYREDGTVALTAFGPSAEVQAAFDSTPPSVDVEVEAVGGLAGLAPAVETRLSDRQREALEAGPALGYYEVPREATGADVATALECAPGTAAEHLRTAEATLVRSLFRPA